MRPAAGVLNEKIKDFVTFTRFTNRSPATRADRHPQRPERDGAGHRGGRQEQRQEPVRRVEPLRHRRRHPPARHPRARHQGSGHGRPHGQDQAHRGHLAQGARGDAWRRAVSEQIVQCQIRSDVRGDAAQRILPGSIGSDRIGWPSPTGRPPWNRRRRQQHGAWKHFGRAGEPLGAPASSSWGRQICSAEAPSLPREGASRRQRSVREAGRLAEGSRGGQPAAACFREAAVSYNACVVCVRGCGCVGVFYGHRVFAHLLFENMITLAFLIYMIHL